MDEKALQTLALARSDDLRRMIACKDWVAVLEICAVIGTIAVDMRDIQRDAESERVGMEV